MPTDFLHGVEVVYVDDGERPIRAQRSSVIGLVATCGKGPVNTPHYIAGNLQEAVDTFGQWDDRDGFTGPVALNKILAQFGASVVVVNVCDPAVHNSAADGEAVTFAGFDRTVKVAHPFVSNFVVNPEISILRTFGSEETGSFQVPDDVVVDSITSEDRDTIYTVGTDYQVSGTTVTRINAGTAPPLNTNVRVTYRAITAVAYTFGEGANPANTITLPEGAQVIRVQSSDGTTTYTEGSGDDYEVAGNVITRVASGSSIGSGATVLVTHTAPLRADEYAVDADTGRLSRAVANSRLFRGATASVSYTYVDPSKVTEAQVEGGIADDTGAYSGVRALMASQSVLGLKPKILLAPFFTHQKALSTTANPVGAALQSVADRLSAVVYVDGPNTTDGAAINLRGDYGSSRVMVLDPWHTVRGPSGADVQIPPSIVQAGVRAQIDNDIGFWASESNKIISGIIGVSRPVEFSLGDASDRANNLNANEVSTTIRENGFRTWGNRSTTEDPLYQFLSVQRTADMIGESIQVSHLWAVDRGITRGLIESIVESVNLYIRSLIAQGAILGGQAWFDPALNNAADVQNGKMAVDYDFTPVYPAERVQFRGHIVNNYVTVLFG